jgi:hypothetical protein
MQVHHALATAGKAAFGCLVLMAFVMAFVLAIVGLDLHPGAGSLQSATPAPLPSSPEDSASEEASSPTPAEVLAARFPGTVTRAATPAEVLAARFPSEDNATQPPTFSTANVIPAWQGETYDLGALSGMATIEPPWPAADGNTPTAKTLEGPESPLQTELSKAQRLSARSPNVVNDAQIASIRRRLRLTAEQEKLWLPVEAALRKIVYTRAAMNPQHGQSPTAYIDPSSPAVNELKSAALPLLMRLNEEQKHEVKMLAFVMGLEAVAAHF